jgi:uncharacterized protein
MIFRAVLPILPADLDDGGFPGYLPERSPELLHELLRDIVRRDIAPRYGLRETRHVMNLALFLLANTGQPFSIQTLAKSLAIPSAAQASRYLEYLQDSYVLFAAPKFSPAFKQRGWAGRLNFPSARQARRGGER